MAAAKDASTTDWIWLREAWDLAIAAFGGSELLAEKRLRGWLGTGDLPWDCDDEDWTAPDAAEIAEQNRILAIPDGDSLFPVYQKKDPRVFVDDLFNVDWKNSAVREGTFFPRPRHEGDGIKVPRTRLLELLSGAPREREETPEPTAPVAAPAPPRNVSEADLRQCLLDIVKERPPHSPPLAEDALINEVERRLGAPVSRARVRQALKDVAPHFKLRRGRPRKNAQ